MPKTKAETIAALLLRFREAKGFTQEEAMQWWSGQAGRAMTWSRWERGAHPPPPALVMRVKGELR